MKSNEKWVVEIYIPTNHDIFQQIHNRFGSLLHSKQLQLWKSNDATFINKTFLGTSSHGYIQHLQDTYGIHILLVFPFSIHIWYILKTWYWIDVNTPCFFLLSKTSIYVYYEQLSTMYYNTANYGIDTATKEIHYITYFLWGTQLKSYLGNNK